MDLLPLHDGRPGIRTLLQIETRSPSNASASDPPLPPVESNVLDFISSTATLDRFHEIIDPVGWRLASYRRNPVFQNAHNYGDILFTLGKALITEVRSGGCDHLPPAVPYLFQRIQFATDVNPIARIAYGLYRGKFLNAVSVGFIPVRWQDIESQKGADAAYRRKYLEQELLEVSAVAIPANPDALALGVKSGAITKFDLAETLDLLRCLTINLEPFSQGGPALRSFSERGPHHSNTPPLHHSTFSHPILHLARELRRILRSA